MAPAGLELVAEDRDTVSTAGWLEFFPYSEAAVQPQCEVFDALRPFQPMFEDDGGWWPWLNYAYRAADADDFEWSRDLFTGIHRVAADTRGHLESVHRRHSRFRTTDLVLSMTDGSRTFTAAPPEAIPGLVDRVCKTMQTWRGHPAAAGAWLTVALTAIQPFDSVNDSVGRSAGCAALYKAGYRAPTLPDCAVGDKGSMFDAEERCLGERFDPTVDVTAYIEWYLRAQIDRALYWIDELPDQQRDRIRLGLERTLDTAEALA